MVVEKPSLETVWGWLHAVPDPEIPVISLTDLGIIRDVQWQGDTLEVTVTPTYSGCPATTIINLDIETALRGHGIEKLALKRQLSPAWTSDWMTDAVSFGLPLQNASRLWPGTSYNFRGFCVLRPDELHLSSKMELHIYRLKLCENSCSRTNEFHWKSMDFIDFDGFP